MDKSGLVGEWRLDEGCGLTAHDNTENGHHGNIHYASWQISNGRHALCFDGTNSRVVIANSEALQIRGDITVCAWLYKNSANRGKRWDAILTKNPGTWDYEFLTSKARSDELAFFSPACEPQEIYGGSPVGWNDWHHVATTRSGDVVTFFLDGIVTSTATMKGYIPVSEGDLVIGHDGANGRGFGMRGMIRDVLLFSRALTDEEVSSIAAAGSNLVRTATSGQRCFACLRQALAENAFAMPF